MYGARIAACNGTPRSGRLGASNAIFSIFHAIRRWFSLQLKCQILLSQMHPSDSQVGGGAIAAAPRRRLCVSEAASGPENVATCPATSVTNS
mmetsp:Transcript_87967/g.264590  ORF Transcript_87967/g.264590 Transcript_87967/m.264590 type:complete len:92 (+) Transcript_87967:1912-2187(+)